MATYLGFMTRSKPDQIMESTEMNEPGNPLVNCTVLGYEVNPSRLARCGAK